MAASLSAEEVRDKVMEDDDEFESEDSDNESEEMEEDAFENDNFLAETLKKTCKGLGKWRIFYQCKCGNVDWKPRSWDNRGRQNSE